MHAARRRVVLQVRVMILLRRGVKHIKRAPRVEGGLAFLVPLALGDDKARFIKEVTNYELLKADYDLIKASLFALNNVYFAFLNY